MRYFTVKEGALVTRFGTGTYLAAVVSVHSVGPLKGQTKIEWTGEVVALTDGDFQAYGREYEQLKAEGALLEVDEAAYDAWNAKQEAATKAAAGQSAQEAAQAKADAAKLESERLANELKALQARAKQAEAESLEASKLLDAVSKPEPTASKPEPAGATAVAEANPKSPAHARSKE